MTTPTTPHSPKSHEDAMGDDHVGTSAHTPLKPDAFALSDEEKMAKIETKFREIMDVMGLDLNDDDLSGTPKRVAKMYVKEIFSGLNPANHPDVKTFDNVYGYNHMLVERDINVNSTCEHHFLPIVGHAHVAYILNGRGGLEQTEPDCGSLCASPSSPGAADASGASIAARAPGHRRRGRGHRRQAPLRVQPRHPR